jgi:lantibiotic modifying enzyme
VGWVNRRVAAVPLTGFAHGAAGVSWALARLASATGGDAFRATAREAMEYERSLFSSTASNWPDLRDSVRAPDGSPRFSVSWCHGAPGIGLARLGMGGDRDDVVDAEVRAAVTATLLAGLGGNHSLCHGTLGNLEMLRRAATRLADAALAGTCADAVAATARAVLAGRVRTGVSREAEVPGLMTGSAGIGLALLREAWPAAVPSVLLLEPPHRVAGASTAADGPRW